jgi:hypothetical protein
MSSIIVTPVTPFETMLEPFGIPKPDLANFLGPRNAVVGGSFAIASLLHVEDTFTPGDMDIFMPNPWYLRDPKSSEAIAYFEVITTWFSQYGYIEDSVSYGHENNYDFSLYIFKVQTFKHTTSGAKIDVVHITSRCDYVLRHTDFTINDTYIAFRTERHDFPVYEEYYVCNHYDDLVNKRLVLYKAPDIFSNYFIPTFPKNIGCPIDRVTAPKRLARLEKYLARGFHMPSDITVSIYKVEPYRSMERVELPVNEETYRARLAHFM